jgi:hypothetical protein
VPEAIVVAIKNSQGSKINQRKSAGISRRSLPRELKIWQSCAKIKHINTQANEQSFKKGKNNLRKIAWQNL